MLKSQWMRIENEEGWRQGSIIGGSRYLDLRQVALVAFSGNSPDQKNVCSLLFTIHLSLRPPSTSRLIDLNNGPLPVRTDLIGTCTGCDWFFLHYTAVASKNTGTINIKET